MPDWSYMRNSLDIYSFSSLTVCDFLCARCCNILTLLSRGFCSCVRTCAIRTYAISAARGNYVAWYNENICISGTSPLPSPRPWMLSSNSENRSSMLLSTIPYSWWIFLSSGLGVKSLQQSPLTRNYSEYRLLVMSQEFPSHLTAGNSRSSCMSYLIQLHMWYLMVAHTVGAASFAARIVADLIALVVTWVKTFHQVRLASSAGMNTGFSGVLLRDGMSVHRSMVVLHSERCVITGSIFFV